MTSKRERKIAKAKSFHNDYYTESNNNLLDIFKYKDLELLTPDEELELTTIVYNYYSILSKGFNSRNVGRKKKYELGDKGYIERVIHKDKITEELNKLNISKDEFQLIKNNCLKAKDILIKRNIRLVIKEVRKLSISKIRISFDDLFQQGMLGLNLAIEKYNPKLGYRLSTYAVTWIRQMIIRYIQNNSNIIRIPVDKINIINDTSKQSRFNKDQLDYLLSITQSSHSLDLILDHEDDSSGISLMELHYDSNSYLPIDNISRIELLENINIIISKELTEKEAMFIKLRYGLDIRYPNVFMSIAAIAKIVNYTDSYVRNSINKAINKLKYSSDFKKLKDYLDLFFN